jgi:predicted Zn-dependent protease
VEGRFFDGRTAQAHSVRVQAQPDALTIEGDGVSARWAGARLVQISADKHEIRLGVDDDVDARLVLARTPELDAALVALGLRARDRSRRIALVASVVGVSAALIALIFFVAPLAAEPLARATPADVEDQLGENMAAQITLVMKPCSVQAHAAIAPLAERLAPDTPVRVTLVQNEIKNAFALPGGRVMVTSGLIAAVEQPDELAAVLAHEIGHAQARDGLVAPYRNAGLGLALEAVTGGSGLAQQLVLLAGQLTNLRYTREQEARADGYALAAMAQAGLDPAALARAFGRIAPEEAAAGKRGARMPFGAEEWLLSHPDVAARIARARAAAQPARAPAMTETDWQAVRAACSASE